MKFAHFLSLTLALPQIVHAQATSPGTHPAMAEFSVALRQATSHEVSNEDLLSASRDLAAAAGNTEGLGSGTVIHRAIIDKNARIGSNVIISNDAGIEQGEGEGYVISDGIVVIPKDAIIPDGTRI